MATPSIILVWRIPWTEEPGGLRSIGSQSWTQLKGLSKEQGGALWLWCVGCFGAAFVVCSAGSRVQGLQLWQLTAL